MNAVPVKPNYVRRRCLGPARTARGKAIAEHWFISTHAGHRVCLKCQALQQALADGVGRALRVVVEV